MAAFDEVQLDTAVSEGASGGPTYNTVVIVTSSGQEQRIGTWGVGRLMWDVAHGQKTPAQMTALVAFFRARGGRARGFRFKDWTDYSVAGQALTNPYPATAMQLVKTYTSSVTETRKILKPVSGTVTILKNAVALVLTTDYTIDYTTGIVTLVAPVNGAAYTWSGQFDVPVRFDTDVMKYSGDAVTIQSWNSIPVVELLY